MELKREQSIFAHRLSNIDFFFFVQPNYVEDDDDDDLYSRKEHNLPVCLNYFSQQSVFYINLCCKSLLNLPQTRIFGCLFVCGVRCT